MSDNDVERLLTGRAPAAGDPGLEELALFVRALGAAVPEAAADPDPALIARLADAAGASAATTVAVPTRARTRARRSPARLLARAGIAGAMVPVLFAGLAVAGVHLPGPADDAFNSVGIELPNQSDSAASDEATGKGGSDDSADDRKGSNGKGEATRRSKRRAYGPSRSARPNPPGNEVRRGPNPSPGDPRGKPDSLPSEGSGGGANANANANANGSGSAPGLSKQPETPKK